MVEVVMSGVWGVLLLKWPLENRHGMLMNTPIIWRLSSRSVLFGITHYGEFV